MASKADVRTPGLRATGPPQRRLPSFLTCPTVPTSGVREGGTAGFPVAADVGRAGPDILPAVLFPLLLVVNFRLKSAIFGIRQSLLFRFSSQVKSRPREGWRHAAAEMVRDVERWPVSIQGRGNTLSALSQIGCRHRAAALGTAGRPQTP